jgi:glutaredoxin-related protein
VPEVERLLPRFRAAHTQVLGVSVDSIFCHANWGQSMGGISFPLLADFHPKGAMARAYGLYLDEAGITDRATVIIDAGGVVRHVSSVTPGGRRNIDDLAALCEQIDREYGSGLPGFPTAEGVGKIDALYVKSQCGHSRKVMLARENLHLQQQIPLKNVTDDDAARNELVRLAGKDEAPCLVVGGKPMHGSDDILRYLASGATTLG